MENIFGEIKQKPSGYICIMESKRQQKMGKEVQKVLSDIFIRHGRNYFKGVMVTITQVKLTPDLGLARVYLSIFPNKNGEEFFENLEKHKSEIRKHLGNEMGKRTRKIPDLEFYHDEVEEEASRIDKLISDLNIPPAPEKE